MTGSEISEKAIQTLVQGARPRFKKISVAQPLGVTWEQESAFAVQALRKSHILLRCDPASVKDAIVNVASIGLSLNPALQHAALVPRYNRDSKQFMCCLDPMYRGLIHLALQGGAVTSVRADVVYEGDVEDGNFKYISGTNPQIIHNPNPFRSAKDRGPIVGAYVVAEIPDSKFPHVTVINRERIEKIRGMSETYKKHKAGTWVDHEEEMIKKTVIKIGSKTWGTGDVRIQQAVALANASEGFGDESVIEGEAVEVMRITKGQERDLVAMAKDHGIPIEKITKSYGLGSLGELPREKFDECLQRIKIAGATNVIRHAKDGATLSAKNFGLTPTELKQMVAEAGRQLTVVA